MPNNNTRYHVSWEKDYDWLEKSEDCGSAKCKLCKSTFKINSSGIGQVKIHAKGTKHASLEAVKTNQTNQATFVSSDNNQLILNKGKFILSPEEKVLKSEILWALKCTENNWSFASNNGMGNLFKMMFPDSAIAKTYCMSETKSKYLVQFGIAPYVQELLKEDLQGKPFTFKFDETTTVQVKKQYDAYVQFFSDKHQKIINHYCGSMFVGHCTAVQLLEHFFHFMKLFNCDVKFLLHIGMDGPNVNKSFQRELEKELQRNYNKTILNIGTCSLHQVHTAYIKGLNCIDFNYDEFSHDLHFFFKLSSARREDFQLVSLVTELKSQFMIRHVNSRWLSLKRVLSRIYDQWDNLCEYFLRSLPKEKNFEKEIGKTDRYKRIVQKLKCQKTKIYLSFAVYLAEPLEHFLLKFQAHQPLVHILYPEIGGLLMNIMSKFLKKEVICRLDQTSDQLLPKPAKDLGLINPSEHSSQIHHMDIDIGTNTRYILALWEAKHKNTAISNIRTEFKLCYIELTKHLQLRLPHQSTVLHDLQYLNPKLRLHSEAVSAIGRLAYTLGTVLKDRTKTVFTLENEVTPGTLSDMIQNDFKTYQLEAIDQLLHEDVIVNQIDQYWSKIEKITDLQGKQKYKKLTSFSKCCLSLSHGNVIPEHGFSLNKFLLENRISLSEETIIALRIVKDSLNLYTVEKFPFTKRLLNLVGNSKKQYMVYLENKKREELLEAEQINQKAEAKKKQKHK